MYRPASSRHRSRFSLWLLLSVMLVLLSSPAAFAAPGAAPTDELWQVVDEIDFPDRVSPPTTFTGLTLDIATLKAILAEAPREGSRPFSMDVVIPLPLPDGHFSEVAVVSTQLMEPALAAGFPEIKTYAVEGTVDRSITGHLVVGPGEIHAVVQTPGGLLRIDPVQTDEGTFYLSFLDRHRTDGSNVFDHPDDEQPPASPVPLAQALGHDEAQHQGREHAGQQLAIDSGDTLRIYRLAAATTGQFYQARDNGAGDLDVLFSLIVEMVGVNAVFEPEVGVRLILSLATLDVLYDDPLADPFDNTDTPCNLRAANRNDSAAVLDDDDYDLGFLFATQAGGGNSGCAWYNVCLTQAGLLHKAAAAGKIGNNGANSATGLLLHEVGHQLGARHTYSGQAGGCNAANFDPESAYAPGSGSTIMSYRGNCADQAGNPPPPPPPPLMNDNVDTSNVPAGTYYHTTSFEEIVENVSNGDGATCGTPVAAGNLAPSVDAGPDFTIPQGTPFTLTGSATDADPLTHTWEQFDVADTQRPIDTDDGKGPIIRSVPPTIDPSRTIPNLSDLINGLTPRRGEILPSTDRDLTFRFTARDNRMGGGGVAYDTAVIHVQGDPFSIISPNGGEVIGAGCPLPVTWNVGGGSVADSVDLLFAADGGNIFTPLVSTTPNDGIEAGTTCTVTGQARIKAEAVDNIFFDVSDSDFAIVSTPPNVSVSAVGGEVDDACQFEVTFEATVEDDCGVSANDVAVDVFPADDNFALGSPTVNIVQANSTMVSVTGSVVVSEVVDSPATLTIEVTGADACSAETSDAVEVEVVDTTPPTIAVGLQPESLWPPNHKLRDVTANVTVMDNCPAPAFTLTAVTSNEPDNGPADGNTVNDIQNADVGTSDTSFSLRAERAGNGAGRVYTATYTATDASDNQAQDSDTVLVPLSQ